MSLLPAVILGSHANALSFARSLGRRGVPVWLVDSENALGRYTRYARVLALPHVEQAPDAWLETLTTLGRRLGPSVLFSTTDAHCLWLAQNRTALQDCFRFLTVDADTTASILDKCRQYKIARAAGIPVPNTFCPDSVQALDAIAAQLTYPCLLKPAVSHRGRTALKGAKVVVAHTAQELRAAYARLASPAQPFFVQEVVPGSDDAIYVYLGLWDESAQERCYITLQKLRQYPPRFGSGSLFQTVTQPRIVDSARCLLHALQYRGLAEIEFKYDARTDTFCLIEINPRAGTMVQVAAAAGIDLGWLTYRYLCDGALPATAPFQTHVRVVDEEIDLLSFVALSRTHELSARDWLRSIRNAKPLIAAWDDPLPFVMGIGRGIKRLLNKS